MTRARRLAGYAKALAGGAVAGLAVLRADLPHGVTGQEWCDVAIATLGGLGIVAGVPNARSRRARVAASSSNAYGQD